MLSTGHTHAELWPFSLLLLTIFIISKGPGIFAALIIHTHTEIQTRLLCFYNY